MRGAGAGSSYSQTKSRYITTTSVFSDTLVNHKRHLRVTKKLQTSYVPSASKTWF